MRRRDVGADELVQAAIERTEARNVEVGAVVFTRYEEALREARTATGPFAGVPIMIKDAGEEIAGCHYAIGTPVLKALGYRSTHTTPLTSALQALGFVVIAKTNVPELSAGNTTEPAAFGPSRTPWDLSRSAGGSSGGSAAAVASGMVAIAQGSGRPLVEGDVDPTVLQQARRETRVGVEAQVAAVHAIDAAMSPLRDWWNEFDLLVTPTMRQPPWPLGEVTGPLHSGVFPVPFSFTGQPALSVPLHRTGDVPVGVQIVGRSGRRSVAARRRHRARRFVALADDRSRSVRSGSDRGGHVESFDGLLAVVTGGGTGMGRELVIQLAREGCSVAACDVIPETLAETAKLAANEAKPGVKITTHICDVADAAQMDNFRDEVLREHDTDHVNLVFNNAGIGGGGSFVAGKRDEWDRVFGICWGGVYNGARAFVPLLVASDNGYLINTSSVNGFWASLGPGNPHTAYSAAKFAVKGFSEALIEDFRVNAPHVKVAVVMPGHIGTEIINNSRRIMGGREPEDMTEEDLAEARTQMSRRGFPADSASDDDIRNMIKGMADMFRNNAPVSSAQAAVVILDGVKAGKWRILIGEDAHALDKAVRADPEGIYGEGGLDLQSLQR